MNEDDKMNYAHFSDILYGKERYDLNEIIKNPPKGVWIKKYSAKFIVGASFYSKEALPLLFLSAIGLLPFAGVAGTIILYGKIIYVIAWLPFLIVSGI
jgi:hypothetical protein